MVARFTKGAKLSTFKLLKGGSISITLETMKFLKDWLHDHILQKDKKYGPYLNSKGIK